MKKLFKYAPYLALFGLVVIVAAVFRAVSIAKNEGTSGIKVSAGNHAKAFARYLWLEIKGVLRFSRY